MNKIESSRRLILRALLSGQRITAMDANMIGNTTAGARRIRQIREDHPVRKERVPGEMYYRYFFDDDYLSQWWKSKSS